MKILYVDESGTVNSGCYIVVGVAVSPEQKREIEDILNNIVAKTRHNNVKDFEIHANEIFSGRGKFWRKIDKSIRIQFIKDCLEEVFNKVTPKIHVSIALGDFKSAKQHNIEADMIPTIENSMYRIINSFNSDLVLNGENGFVISDRLTREPEIQTEFYNNPHSNIAEVPLFLDSDKSRMLQFVDLVAYAQWRILTEQDWQFWQFIPKGLTFNEEHNESFT